MQKFQYIPTISDAQPEFIRILERLKNKQKMAYLKINHGIWEMLVQIEEAGIDRRDILSTEGEKLDSIIGISIKNKTKELTNEKPENPRKTLQKLLGNREVPFWATGLMSDVLKQISYLPSYNSGMILAPSLVPFPYCDQIVGTPHRNYHQCLELINFFIDPNYLNSIQEIELSGNEFKSSVISGHFWHFISSLQQRNILVIAHEDASLLFNSAGLEGLESYIVPVAGARLQRYEIRNFLFDWLNRHQGKSPVVITSAGEALCTWLGIEAFNKFNDIQFIDLGGTMAAFSPNLASRTPWVNLYGGALYSQLNNWPSNISSQMKPIFEEYNKTRNQDLINLASQFGVSKPKPSEASCVQTKKIPISFVESKHISYQRLNDFLHLSEKEKRFTNSGPVSKLLEKAIAEILNLPNHRKTIVVNNQNSALHLACGVTELATNKLSKFRWVSSVFSPLSTYKGILADAKVMDCTSDGTFNIKLLKKLNKSSYDGVIFSNTHASKETWEAVQKFCDENGKALIIDNAAGLLDRPESSLKPHTAIEIVSAGHDMPWGHGECGIIICDATQENLIRKLSANEKELPQRAYPYAMSAQLSELSAAAVLDRLERMPEWRRNYLMQQARHRSWIAHEKLKIKILSAKNLKSPAGFTTILCQSPINWSNAPSDFIVRSYTDLFIIPSDNSFPNAKALLTNAFCISNSPEMRQITRSVFTSEIRRFLDDS